MSFKSLPPRAAWRHLGAREGFEVVFVSAYFEGHRFEGQTTAVEAGDVWAVSYAITVDAAWRTRSARVSGRSATGARHVTLQGDGAGSWRIDGAAAPQLDGCLDVDLESSALTNAFPVHRLALEVAQEAAAPAAYVRASGLGVERLEQRYVRVADEGLEQRYDYASPGFGFAARLEYDESGLVLVYPGIAVRAA